MDARRILFVEDDSELSKLTAEFLQTEGFIVDRAEDAVEALRFLAVRKPDLVLTDWMLPGEDGLSLCRRIRAQSNLPVIMLTAKGQDVDRIVGLEIGADDFVTKPFNPRELAARIRAVLRRTRGDHAAQPMATRRLRFSTFTADLDAHSLSRENGQVIDLTTTEFMLLTCFITHSQRVLSRDQLFEWTRGRGADSFDRTIDVQVSRLRKKIGDNGEAPMIKSIRNVGYLFTLPVVEL